MMMKRFQRNVRSIYGIIVGVWIDDTVTVEESLIFREKGVCEWK